MKHNSFNIQINSDKILIAREAITERILEIRVQAPTAATENSRPNLNLALVLDRSGSMQGEKLAYVKQAACHVLDQLKETDLVALVVYDDTIQVLSRNIHVTHGNRFELKQLINGIRSGDMTNLGGGWLTGCKEIATSAREGGLNRTMLLSDGLANVGETDLEVLSQHAFEIYKDAISTSTFGVGEGFNEHLLEAMANRGGGNFYFIPQPAQIPEIFLKEFSDLAGVTARKVEIILDLPRPVEWKVLGGWTAEQKDGRLHIYVGDMLSGKLQDIYVKLQVPAWDKTVKWAIKAKAFGQGEASVVLESQAEVAFQYACQIEVEAAVLNQGLMERFSLVEVADNATEALKLERRGEREKASRLLHESIMRHHPHLSPQAAAAYQRKSDRMMAGMTEAERKQTHYDAYNIRRQKEDMDKEEE